MNNRRRKREQENAGLIRLRNAVDGGSHHSFVDDDPRSSSHPDRPIGTARRAVGPDPGRASRGASGPVFVPLRDPKEHAYGRKDEESLDRGFSPLREGAIFDRWRRKRGYRS